MKKLFFAVLFLFVFSFSFSQNIIEKWNNLTNRYEYYDSNGNMVAYKVYNSLKGQWETYNIQQTNSSPQSSINVDLAEKTLNTLQARYDSNILKVRDKIKYIFKSIDYLVLDVMTKGENPTELDYKYAEHLKYLFKEQYVNNVEKSGYDYSKNNITYEVLMYLENGSISLIKKEIDWLEDKDFYYSLVRKFTEKVQN